jgi:hypothetical protein
MECGAATTFLRIEEIEWYQQTRVNPLNPEHEAIGRVPWVELDNLYQYFTSPLGGFNPRVVRKKDLSQYGDLLHY